MLELLRLECKQKISLNAFRNCIVLFLSHSFGIETINKFIRFRRSSLEIHTRFQTKMCRVFTRFQTKKGPKAIPFGAALTYMACIREYLPPPPVPLKIPCPYKYTIQMLLLILVSDLTALFYTGSRGSFSGI